jgi:hypothetical protein
LGQIIFCCSWLVVGCLAASLCIMW